MSSWRAQRYRSVLLVAMVVLGVVLVWRWAASGPDPVPSTDVDRGEQQTEASEEPLGLVGAPGRPAPPTGEPAPVTNTQEVIGPDDAPPKPKPARVEGRVVDESGKPVPNAGVWVLSDNGARVYKTDDHGNFHVDGNDDGPVRLLATMPGDFTRGSSTGEVTARDGDRGVELRVRALISTTIVLEGWTRESIGISLTREDGAPHMMDVPASGRVVVRGLTPGATYTVFAGNRHQIGFILALRPEDAETHVIQMAPGFPLSVEVAGTSTFTGVSVDAIIGHTFSGAARKRDGHFVFRCLPAGEWRIRVLGMSGKQDVVETEAWIQIPWAHDEPLSLSLAATPPRSDVGGG